MSRSSLLVFPAALSLVVGCTIITNPAPGPATGPRTAGQGNVARAPAAPATAVAPVATAAATAAPVGAAGPKVNVDGKDYTTLRSPVVFGSGDNAKGSFRGLVYFLPSTTTTLPNFDTLTPTGVLFTTSFGVAVSNYTQGLPGLDDARNDYFGIKYNGTFLTTVVGEYQFRLESDDGARLTIDSVPVVSNDGVHTTSSKTGYLKLAPGAHDFKLEYFQAAKGAVALRLFVTSPSGGERPFSVAF
jgi:hypothetical protein